MDIKVNDYVRIVDDLGKQFVGKVYNVNVNDYRDREPSTKYAIDCQIFNDYAFVGEERIVKSSPRIIDLIEVGDYVNGCRITYINEPNEYNAKRILNYEEPEDYVLRTFDNEDIKSIVTKEIFEQMEYKVGE